MIKSKETPPAQTMNRSNVKFCGLHAEPHSDRHDIELSTALYTYISQRKHGVTRP